MNHWFGCAIRWPRSLDARCSMAALALILLTGCAARPAPIALKQVVLYQSGIGYFEHQGTLTGGTLRLRMQPHEIDDVIKSLTVIDRAAKEHAPLITAVIPDPPVSPPPSSHGPTPRPDTDKSAWLELNLGAERRHDLLIAYSVPTPVWKATYRVVLPGAEAEEEKAGALIQGWALVHNASGEDWDDVTLTLATGAPMSFAINLSRPQFIARPDLDGALVQPAATGAVLSESARPVAGDADGDGIPDAKDLCPLAAEDLDGFEDDDGCPDLDNDGDRIPDALDLCPNEPEDYNGVDDEDGCPDRGRMVVEKSHIEILDKIYFARGSAEIKDRSRPIIEAIAATLKHNPNILVVEVQGHASPAEGNAWGLSASRSGAVRAALARLGVRTELRARAYGATQVVAAGAGEEHQARNRRVELSILFQTSDREVESRAGAVNTAVAERSMPPGLALATVAGMVRYRLPEPISLRRGTTTMVTLLNRRVEGQEVFLYRPDEKVPGSAHHPQRAVMLQNGHELTLEPGPVTIYARGSFVGEGLLSRLQPGQTAFIPYALDSSASVRVTSATEETPSAFISFIDGVATVEDRHERVTRYEVQLGQGAPGQLVVNHPRREGYELHALPPGTRTTATDALVPFPISDSSRSVLEIKERRPVRRSITITDAREPDDRLTLYLKGTTALSPKAKQQLSRLIQAQRELARLRETADALRGQISDLGVQSGELREGLKSVSSTQEAAALRRTLLQRLTQAMSEMNRVTRRLTETNVQLFTARRTLKELVTEVRIPVVP